VNTENPVNGITACVELGKPGKPWGRTRMSAIKKAMGITNQRYFFLSDVRKWLRAHPEFRNRTSYPVRSNKQLKAA
jgi:hypothetical protein